MAVVFCVPSSQCHGLVCDCGISWSYSLGFVCVSREGLANETTGFMLEKDQHLGAALYIYFVCTQTELSHLYESF